MIVMSMLQEMVTLGVEIRGIELCFITHHHAETDATMAFAEVDVGL